MSSSKERLDRVMKYLKNRLDEDAVEYGVPARWLEYRFLHTLRVANIGRELAEAEGANVDLTVAGCLLHDIASFRSEPPDDPYSHGRIGAALIRPDLPDLGFSAEETDNICFSVALHADGKAGYDHPETLEAKIVSDADNIDRFDAYRLLEYCTPHMESFPALIEAAEKRLQRLEHYRSTRVMGTDSGHALFNQKLDMQILVYRALLAQNAISRMPEL